MNAAGGSLEIERKFLLHRMPAVPANTKVRLIVQGYFASDAEGPFRDMEGRLRREVCSDGSVIFTHTVKRGLGLVRTEQERKLTADEFARLWPGTEGRRLRKMRYLVREGEFVWAVDAFADFDLILAEVELPSEDAHAPLPAWLEPVVVREVTGEEAFQNYALARKMLESRRL